MFPLLRYILLVTALQLAGVPVKATFVFEVRVQSYNNPRGKLSDGSDCDVFDGCEPYYDFFCLRESGHSRNDRSHCPLGKNGENIFDLTVTRTIESTLPWPGAFQLYIFMKEDDFFSSDDALANVFAESEVQPGSDFSQLQAFTGNYVTLGLQFRVSCQVDFYGPNCSTLCRPRDDISGHFVCSNEVVGAVDCLPGYQHPETDCIDAICKDGCNSTGGFCDLPGQCLCREGWNGTLCDQEINACGDFPCQNGGSCIPNGTVDYFCVCPPGVDGDACENDTLDGCLVNPCRNGGNCTDLAPGESYACSCPFGLGGDNCTEDTVNSCLSNPCSIVELCTDLLEGYKCDCVPGYTGVDCSINIDDCLSVVCRQNAVCVDDVNAYRCVCQMGFEEPNCTVASNGDADSQSGDSSSTGIVAGAVVGGFVLLICILLLILVAILILRRRTKKAPADHVLLKDVRSRPHPYETSESPVEITTKDLSPGNSPPPPSKEAAVKFGSLPPLPSSLADNPLYGQTSPEHELGGHVYVSPADGTKATSPETLRDLDNPLYVPGGADGTEIYSEPNEAYGAYQSGLDQSADEPTAYAYARLKESNKSELGTQAGTQLEGYTVLGTAGTGSGTAPYSTLDRTGSSKEEPVRRLAKEEGSGYDALF